MRHLTYTGKVLYLTDGIGEEGREHFSISIQPDQSRTSRAVCEMDNDRLIRDVVYSLDGLMASVGVFRPPDSERDILRQGDVSLLR